MQLKDDELTLWINRYKSLKKLTKKLYVIAATGKRDKHTCKVLSEYDSFMQDE